MSCVKGSLMHAIVNDPEKYRLCFRPRRKKRPFSVAGHPGGGTCVLSFRMQEATRRHPGSTPAAPRQRAADVPALGPESPREAPPARDPRGFWPWPWTTDLELRRYHTIPGTLHTEKAAKRFISRLCYFVRSNSRLFQFRVTVNEIILVMGVFNVRDRASERCWVPTLLV